ncbi:F-box/WD repeat-containing protein 12 isoform X2 [Fukomys damarensis]|uniref:F-box/WD repeat-containing protein 12 isoform X2 n=1 Tax=Fukomys damarensis TaxID=885580 RepID=UPI00145543EC|nr:F-box/WD repeat-containing protein 12 isoform X2 [Fukomys damarensis]
MAVPLHPDELLHVFSFLEARDLLCAAQVNKVWNEVSQTKELWRHLCLSRWSSCKASRMVLGTQTWKQYYLCRSELEFRVTSGRPGKDFICKAIAGHTGYIEQLAYISTNEYRFDGREKSVICTVSSDCTVRAWDLHEGTEIWSSPRQPVPLKNLVTYPQLQLVVTIDIQGLIKMWKAETGWELASFGLPTSSSAVELCDRPEAPFLLVFYTQSLACPSEDEPPVSTTLPLWMCSQACWAPDEAARLIVVHKNENEDDMQLVVTTFELRAKKSSKDRVDILVKQVASFLPDTLMSPHLMQGYGSQVILLTFGLELMLFTIHGLQLVAFQDHQKPITSMRVDLDRVITSSMDLSLRVYVWNKENKFPVLKSCYHLLGGSHKWASGFTHVESDSTNIVGVEARSNGTSILRSYCFKIQHG